MPAEATPSLAPEPLRLIDHRVLAAETRGNVPSREWLDVLADPHPDLKFLSQLRCGARPVAARHAFRCPAEQQHQVAGVTASQVPFVGEVVPPPMRVGVVDAGGGAAAFEHQLDPVRRKAADALVGHPQVRDVGGAFALGAGPEIA